MSLDFSRIFYSLPDATMVVSVEDDMKVVDANPACIELFKAKSLEDFTAVPVFILSPEFQEDGSLSAVKGKDMVMKMIENGSHYFDWRHKDFEGNIIECSVHGSSFRVEGKIYLVAAIRDITERFKQQNTKKEQTRFFQTTIDTMPAIFYAKDREGVFTHVNQEFLNLVKKTHEEVVGKSVYEIFPKEVADEFRRTDREVERSKLKNESEEYAFDTEGNKLFYQSFKFPYVNAQGEVKATGGISIDTTEKRRLQKIVIHQSKLASLGELSARIGHKINNPLTIISGYLDILAENGLDEKTRVKYIEVLQKSSKRIAVIVEELRKFARKEEDEKVVFNARTTIQETYQLMSDLLSKEGIKFSLNWDSNRNFYLFGTAGRLNQILVNLITNAKDAVISAKREEKRIHIEVKDIGERLKIIVKDNGAGIPEKIRRNIFDPFFTTKETNKGTGIGLALVHNFVMEFEGSIDLSTSSSGTEFYLEFPLREGEVPPEEVYQKQSKNYSLNVLVVGDEEEIRELLKLVLGQLGANVTVAEDAYEAKDILKNKKFDLILSDINMPKVSGIELLNSLEFEGKRPFLVLNTGGSIENFDTAPEFEKIDTFLLKPYGENELEGLLKQASEFLKR